MSRKVERFVDLIAWQKARGFAREIHIATRSNGFDWGLRDQMFRAARSVMGNIAEGFDRVGMREFHKGLSIASGSCAEVRSDLYLALDCGYITPEKFAQLYEQGSEVARVLGALCASVARRIAAQDAT